MRRIATAAAALLLAAGCGEDEREPTPTETAAPACHPAAPDDDDFDSGDEPELIEGHRGTPMGYDADGNPCELGDGDWLVDEDAESGGHGFIG